MSKKTIKMAFQGNLLWHWGKDHSVLVLVIKTIWKNKTTDLSDTILQVTRHAEINKRNKENSVSNAKVLATNIHKASKGICTTKKCMEQGVTTYYTNCCWVLHPKLCIKYSLRQMRPKRLNQNLKKTANILNALTDNAASGENIPEIVSWQPQVFSVEGPRKNCWLVDLAADVHVCNDHLLITEYQERPTKIGRSTSDRIFLRKGKIRLRLGFKNGSKGLILNL